MIYVVIGSEDGYLHTFQSRKKAIQYSALYVTGYNSPLAEAMEAVEVSGGEHEFMVSGRNGYTSVFVDNFYRGNIAGIVPN